MLNFYADGQRILSVDVEANPGTPYVLADILSANGKSVSGCRDYNFVGWKTGGPVVGDETPTIITTVSPSANMNLYAVYEKTGAAPNRYKRITSTKDLHTGEPYMLVCYYEWDGDIYYGPSYWALGNENELNASYWSVGIKDTIYDYNRYRQYQSHIVDWYLYGMWNISADQVYPSAGAIDNPADANVWTLGGGEDAWTFTNVGNTNRRLNIRRNYNQVGYDQTWNGYDRYGNQVTTSGWKIVYNLNEQLLTNPGNTFAITAADGKFNFRADNGRYLTYSDDDDDYFTTGTSNSWTFYLYKKESAYTSFPNCEDWTLHLDAADGFVGTSSNHKVDSVEREPGAGIILPVATRPSASCTDWTFAGWVAEAPVMGQQDPQYGKSNAPELISEGTTYHPKYNGEILYAVFEKTDDDVVYYEKIANRNTLVNGRTYVIASTYNKAVTNTIYDGSGFEQEAVTIVGNEIASAVGENIQWISEYSNSRWYFKKGDVYLSYNGTSPKYYVNTTAAPFSFKLEGYNYYLVSVTDGINNFFGLYAQDVESFNIYERKSRSVTTYTSFPHCTKYTITLHGCGGEINGVGDKEAREMTEGSAGGGFDLPTATPDCKNRGWSFVGWLEGGDLASVEDIEFTGLQTGHYKPARDSVHLYPVFRRTIEKYRIVSYPYNMLADDSYLITHYQSLLDYEISAEAYNGTTLKGVRGESPQDGTGWYILASDSAVIWRLGGNATDGWTFYNDSVGKYLNLNTSTGALTMSSNATEFTIVRPYSALQLKIFAGSYYPNYDGTKFGTTTSENDDLFLYRQMKEYTSWPHCETFTVNFDGCGGTASATSLTEENATEGVTLPTAYANSDCSKEGWTFAGWSTTPVENESDALPVDLLLAGSHYDLKANNSTLYAVYCNPEEAYRRISSSDELKRGVNYLITNSASTKALSNTYYDVPNARNLAAVNVSASGSIITSTDATLDWRLGGRVGEYELYNPANDVYLDLRNDEYPYAAISSLADTIPDNFLITVVGGKMVLRSNRNLLTSNEDVKYLGCAGDYFNIVNYATATANGINFYQQEALYHSYPSCISDVDVIKWETKADGNYVTVESYILSGEPAMEGASGHATDQATDKSGTAQDGTWLIKYTDGSLSPCTQTTVAWGTKTADIRIPYIIDSDETSSKLLGETDCRTCDLVVMSGKTFTVNNNKRLHMVTVQEGATLNIADGATLTINSLVLGANSDQNAPIVNLNNSGAIVLKNKELYYDLRIPEDRYYWISLPFASQTQEISYSNVAANGGMPVYNENFFVYYYDGASRAADANAGSVKDTYWTPVAANGVDYTMQAGQGYLFAILDQASTPQTDGRYHTKRVMRFTMRPPVATWLTQERVGGSKTTTVSPSACTDSRQAFHAGWNLIGNPYMHAYNTGTVSGGDESGLSNGAWTKEIKNAVWTGSWILDETDPTNRPTNVPYITVFDPAATDEYPYSQSLATDFDFRPFQAVFVQVNEGNSLNFLANMAVPASAPAYKRFIQPEVPVRTGVTLSGLGRSDRTGIVLSNEYTTQYEIGADLQKMFNGGLNLYTLNADNQQLAFNGLSEEDAIAPIPVGVTIPTTGEYTFAFDADKYSMQALDTLMLIDYVQDTQTNLLYGNYTFTADQGRNENRFALLVRLAKTPQITTELDNIYDADKPRKIIRDGMLFILRDDKMYNAVGIEVR